MPRRSQDGGRRQEQKNNQEKAQVNAAKKQQEMGFTEPKKSSKPASMPRNRSFLSQLVPAGVDAGDLALIALLLFLYIESEDEDFLIILIVIGFSIFGKDKRKVDK
jgi:hypothetical protein